MPEIIFEHVHFAYGTRGRQQVALQDVTVSIGDGVTGIVGPNGAGKTTFFRLIMGLLVPTGGRVLVDGVSPETFRVTRGFGFIPEHPAFPPYLRVRDFLAGLSALAERAEHGRAAFSVPSVGDLGERRLSELSLGEKRRVELAAAAIGDPPVLLMDEPTNGLDPNGIRWLRDASRALSTANRTVLVASHNLDELQRTVDHVVMLSHGTVHGTWARADAIATYGSFDALFAQNSATGS